MNWRLPEEHEKVASKRGRAKRNAQRQAWRRRQQLLQELTVAHGEGPHLAVDLTTPSQALDILTAHLTRSRAVARQIQHRLAASRITEVPLVQFTKTAPNPRPERVLQHRNRSQIRPGLLLQAIQPERGGTIEEVKNATFQHLDQGVAPHVVLDFFTRSTGLPRSTAAELVSGARPAFNFPSAELEAIEAARVFWDHYADGQRMFRGAVATGEFAADVGTWALVHHGELEGLLPGIRLPKILRRQAYLVNLVKSESGLCLDLYSCPAKLPLIRHPFLS